MSVIRIGRYLCETDDTHTFNPSLMFPPESFNLALVPPLQFASRDVHIAATDPDAITLTSPPLLISGATPCVALLGVARGFERSGADAAPPLFIPVCTEAAARAAHARMRASGGFGAPFAVNPHLRAARAGGADGEFDDGVLDDDKDDAFLLSDDSDSSGSDESDNGKDLQKKKKSKKTRAKGAAEDRSGKDECVAALEAALIDAAKVVPDAVTAKNGETPGAAGRKGNLMIEFSSSTVAQCSSWARQMDELATAAGATVHAALAAADEEAAEAQRLAQGLGEIGGSKPANGKKLKKKGAGARRPRDATDDDVEDADVAAAARSAGAAVGSAGAAAAPAVASIADGMVPVVDVRAVCAHAAKTGGDNAKRGVRRLLRFSAFRDIVLAPLRRASLRELHRTLLAQRAVLLGRPPMEGFRDARLGVPVLPDTASAAASGLAVPAGATCTGATMVALHLDRATPVRHLAHRRLDAERRQLASETRAPVAPAPPLVVADQRELVIVPASDVGGKPQLTWVTTRSESLTLI